MEIFYDAWVQILPRGKEYTRCTTLIVLLFCSIFSSCNFNNCSDFIVKKWTVSTFSSSGEVFNSKSDTFCINEIFNKELPFLTFNRLHFDSIFVKTEDGLNINKLIYIGNLSITISSKITLKDSNGTEHTILFCLSPKKFDFYPFCYEKGIGIVYYVFQRKFYFLKNIKSQNGSLVKYDFLNEILKNDSIYFD